jgi:hypothetical protein
VSWHPDETRLFWISHGKLWTTELPDGQGMTPVSEWHGNERATRSAVDVAWLRR